MRVNHGSWRSVGVVLLILLATACSSESPASASDASVASVTVTTPSTTERSENSQGGSDPATTVSTADIEEPIRPTTAGAGESAGPCAAESSVAATGPTNALESFDVDGVNVGLAVYPRPDYDANPWSHWGQGIVTPDGRFLSAIGDHLGQDGNSYLYAFDPDSGDLTQFSDILSLVGHEDGSWGHGKVHAQMVQTSCDSVIFATYWGDRRGLEVGGSYSGGELFRLDLSTLEIEGLGTPVEGHAIPSMAAAGGLVFGEAAAPIEDAPPEKGVFFVFDPETNEVIYRSDDEDHAGYRSILVDGEGAAFLATRGSDLLKYVPGEELVRSAASLPEGWLRAAATPLADGTVYGVSRKPERFFAMRPDGSIDDLGSAQGYTTTMVLHPDDGTILYLPGAHGDAWEYGASVFQFDPESGSEETLVELNDLAESELGLTLGGTYSMAVDPDRRRLFIEFNAGPSRDEPWGEVVLAVIDL